MATLQWDHAVQFVNQLIHKLYCVVPLQGCHDLSRDCAWSGACGKR